MIRHRKGFEELLEEIEAAKPGWLESAEKRLDHVLKPAGQFSKAKSEDAPAPNWSHVKQVYRNLQGNKCAYCERPLPIAGGAGEHHIEHFRPKGRAVDWDSPASVDDGHQPGRAGGYYWLAYEPWNYTASCYRCNSAEFKGDRFPIRGIRGRAHWSISTLDAKELPVLIYPLGDRDADPEDMIGWRGLVPVGKGAGDKKQRAVANIWFYGLAEEPDLYRGRAAQLVAAWRYIEKEHDAATPAEQQVASARVEQLRHRKKPHAACVRSLIDLARADFEEAKKVFETVERYHLSVGGSRLTVDYLASCD